MILSDVHLPWCHPKALEFCLRVRDEFKPDRIYSVGDFFDLASFSRYPMNPDLPSPHDEIDRAIEAAEDWYEAFDQVDICESNHDSRIIKKLIGSGLPSRVLKDFAEIMHMPPGWKMHEIQIECEGFTIIHGEGFSHSSWRTAYNKMRGSVLMGHLHSGMGISYSNSRKEQQWAANIGCLIDARQKAFQYARFVHERATLGIATVTDGEEVRLWPMPHKLIKGFS